MSEGLTLWFTGQSGAGKSSLANPAAEKLRARNCRVEVIDGDEVRHQHNNFMDVYVKCPLKTLVERDVKGLYQKALNGEISNFTGVSDPYEEPLNPELVIETDRESREESLAKLIAALESLDYISRNGKHQ